MSCLFQSIYKAKIFSHTITVKSVFLWGKVDVSISIFRLEVLFFLWKFSFVVMMLINNQQIFSSSDLSVTLGLDKKKD